MQPWFAPLHFMVLPQKEESEGLIPLRKARQSYFWAAGLRWQQRAEIQASPNTRDLCYPFTLSQRRCGPTGAGLMILVRLMALPLHPFWCRILGSAEGDMLTESSWSCYLPALVILLPEMAKSCYLFCKGGIAAFGWLGKKKRVEILENLNQKVVLVNRRIYPDFCPTKFELVSLYLSVCQKESRSGYLKHNVNSGLTIIIPWWPQHRMKPIAH